MGDECKAGNEYQFKVKMPEDGKIPFGQDTEIQVVMTRKDGFGRYHPDKIDVMSMQETHTMALLGTNLTIVEPRQQDFTFSESEPTTLTFKVRPIERGVRCTLWADIEDPTIGNIYSSAPVELMPASAAAAQPPAPVGRVAVGNPAGVSAVGS